MRLIFFLTLTAVFTYFAKPYLARKSPPSPPPAIKNLQNTEDVLSITSSRVKDSIQNTLAKLKSTTTSSSSPSASPTPLINQAVNQLTEKIQQLPEEEFKKVKREFCQDVIQEALKKEDLNK